MRLNGKSVVITGAGSGVGRASALLFAAEGANVVCADVVAERVHETVELVTAKGDTAVPCVCDVTNEQDVRAAIDAAIETSGPTRHHVQQRRRRDAASRDGVRRPHRRRLGSPDGHQPARRVLRDEAGRDHVQGAGRRRRDREHRVGRGHGRLGRHRLRRHQGRCPPTDPGRGHRGRTARHPRERHLPGRDADHQLQRQHQLRGGREHGGRVASARTDHHPEDCAAAALFLASDEAANLTGVSLPVDGGYIAR